MTSSHIKPSDTLFINPPTPPHNTPSDTPLTTHHLLQARLLGHDPNFPLKKILEENRISEEKRLAHIPDIVLKEDMIDDVMSNGLQLQRRNDGDSGSGSGKNGGGNGGSTRGPSKPRTRTSRSASSSLIPSSMIEDGMDGNSWRNIKPATPSRAVKRQREIEKT